MANRKLLPLIVCCLLGGTSLVLAQGAGGTGGDASGASSPGQNATVGQGTAQGAAQGSQSSGASGAQAPETKAQSGQSMPRGDRAQRNGAKEPSDHRAGPNRAERMDRSGAERGSDGKAMTRNRDKAGHDNKADHGDAETTSPRSTTTGQATGGPRLTEEQRTTVRSSVQNVAPATNINFSIAVGTHVPRGMTFHPLPVEIVTIYPRWRGYEFFRVGDEIVVVNPRTMEIVAVLDV